MTNEPNTTQKPDPAFGLPDRLRKSLAVAEMGIIDMSQYLDVSRGTVGLWISGKTKPNRGVLKLWSMATGVRYEWLLGDDYDE